MKEVCNETCSRDLDIFRREQRYALVTIVSAMILCLPAMTMIVDLIFTKNITFKSLARALFVQPLVVYKAFRVSISPDNLKLKSEFMNVKIYEIAGESICQILLQGGVMIFEFIARQKDGRVILIGERKLELASLATSVVAVTYGISSHWLFDLYQKDPPMIERLRFGVRAALDIVPRLTLTLCFVTVSLEWKEGGMATTCFFCLFLLLSPYICSLFFIKTYLHCMRHFDRTLLVLPMFWRDTTNIDQHSIKSWRNSRIKNKVFGFIVQLSSLVVLVLLAHDAMGVLKHDSWWYCNEQTNVIQEVLKYLFKIILIFLAFSSIELIQCYFWNITWMDGVLLQALKIRNKPFAAQLEEEQTEADIAQAPRENQTSTRTRIRKLTTRFGMKRFEVSENTVLREENCVLWKVFDAFLGIVELIALFTFLIIVLQAKGQEGYVGPVYQAEIMKELPMLQNCANKSLKTEDEKKMFCDIKFKMFSKGLMVYYLHQTIEAGNNELAKTIIECDDIECTILKKFESPEENKYTIQSALHVAIKHQNLEISNLLIHHFKKEINELNYAGLTPLHLALLSKTDVGLQIADALLENGADPTKADSNGRAPLYYTDDVIIAEKMLQINESRTILSSHECTQGLTPVHLLCNRKVDDMTKLMELYWYWDSSSFNELDNNKTDAIGVCCNECRRKLDKDFSKKCTILKKYYKASSLRESRFDNIT